MTNLNIGADGESISFHLGSFNSAALGLSGIDLSEDARQAITYVDDAIDYVNAFRSNLGALQNRAESTISSLGQTAENLSAATSRIRDADFAAETASLTSAQIQQQAATGILSQVSASGQLVLSLLG